MSLPPLSQLLRVRPVAAADYFLSNRWLSWFSRNLIGIIPIRRKQADGGPAEDPLAPCHAALERGDIILFFPEGTRGEPERIGAFKSGICKLSQRFPDMPIAPVFLHGLGKALPKGEAILVPFFVDVFVGEPLRWTVDGASFKRELEERMRGLAAEGNFPAWT